MMALFVLAAVCPKLVCDEYLSGAICAYADNMTVYLNKCSGQFKCQKPKELDSRDYLYCELYHDLQISNQSLLELDVSYHLNKSLLGVVQRGLNESCELPNDWCSRDQNLTCFCGETCLCGLADRLGESCSKQTCEWGSSCQLGVCTQWFSVPSGEVLDPWLCESMRTNKYGECLPNDSNRHILTEPCQADLQCTGRNETANSCRCGFLEMGFCNLMPSDKPYLRLKEAILRRDVETFTEMRLFIENWPYTQETIGHSMPVCFSESWPMLSTVSMPDFSGAIVLGVAFLLLVV